VGVRERGRCRGRSRTERGGKVLLRMGRWVAVVMGGSGSGGGQMVRRGEEVTSKEAKMFVR
jgi:hypothetical protein